MTHHCARRTVYDRLVALGWNGIEHPPFTAIASQVFATATTPKDATLYWYSSSEGNSLVGQYWSEGSNVLSSCIQLFGSADSPEKLIEGVNRFVQRAHQAIDASYARRLHLQLAQAPIPA